MPEQPNSNGLSKICAGHDAESAPSITDRVGLQARAALTKKIRVECLFSRSSRSVRSKTQPATARKRVAFWRRSCVFRFTIAFSVPDAMVISREHDQTLRATMPRQRAEDQARFRHGAVSRRKQLSRSGGGRSRRCSARNASKRSRTRKPIGRGGEGIVS
jgi:hypothetical protein